MFMQSIEPDLENFLGLLMSAQSAPDVWSEAVAYFRRLGVDGMVGFICPSTGAGDFGNRRPVILSQVDAAVVRACADPARTATDPVLLHLATALRPLTFSLHDAARDSGACGTGVAAVAARSGYTWLMAVPARSCPGACVSGMVLLSRQDTASARNLFHNHSIQVAFAAIQTHHRLRQVSVDDAATDTSVLTRREREVLSLSARGLTTREVGETLGISISGVNFHIANAAKKLGAHNRTHATSLALAGRMISV